MSCFGISVSVSRRHLHNWTLVVASCYGPMMGRRRIRKILLWLTGTTVASFVIGPLGEWFIELARQMGWYDNPKETAEGAIAKFLNTLAAISAWISGSFFNPTWMTVGAGVIFAFTAGFWADAWFVRRERPVNQTPVSPPDPKQLESLYNQIERIKPILLRDAMSDSVTFEGFNELSSISNKLARLDIPTPFSPGYRLASDIKTFSGPCYQYLMIIAPYIREGQLDLAARVAKIHLERHRQPDD